jgi:hypothetical protein
MQSFYTSMQQMHKVSRRRPHAQSSFGLRSIVISSEAFSSALNA